MTLIAARAARQHIDELAAALDAFEPALEVIRRWGGELADVLTGGGRLLVAGNGGSAAQAQHLTAEVVGRYREDRQPFSAISLHTDTSSLTAIVNDYGPDEVFARQVQAHGRPGDVCVLMSTSGRSRNVICAAERARACQVTTWALTGRAPNPLAIACDDRLAVDAGDTATVQEMHLVALHLLCEAFDDELHGRQP
jgi:D-sedoheptulose 7-phosphate isomerase